MTLKTNEQFTLYYLTEISQAGIIGEENDVYRKIGCIPDNFRVEKKYRIDAFGEGASYPPSSYKPVHRYCSEHQVIVVSSGTLFSESNCNTTVTMAVVANIMCCEGESYTHQLTYDAADAIWNQLNDGACITQDKIKDKTIIIN